MKVCVTALNPGLDAEVDPRFGRAKYFVFVDTGTMKAESVPNPNVDAYGGAGIRSAQLVVDKGAEVVITGHVGPNAKDALEAAGVKVVTGFQGLTVKEAVERFRGGDIGDSERSVDPLEALRRELEQLKERVSAIERRLEELGR